MKKRLKTMASAILTLQTAVFAQGVSYNHDEAKMNQITVAETGTGSLTPSLYYQTLHHSYQKTAASKNKMSFRTLAGINRYKQVDDATALDSAMIKRAEIEALNVADRSGGTLDLAWSAEGDKLTTKMNDFERNINRIPSAGGTNAEQEYWRGFYHMFQKAITAMQDGYMPNSCRKKQYLKIYADVAKKNEALVYYLVRLSKTRTTRRLLAATNTIENHKAQIIVTALSRWRDAGWNTVAYKQ